MRPDGFGGFVERDEEVKSINARVIDAAQDALTGGAPPAPPTQQAAPPPPPPAPAQSASTRSSQAQSTDDLINNSVASKEAVLGRKARQAGDVADGGS